MIKMAENKEYRCVHCGEPSGALFRTYGPSVLKLTKCSCKNIVDKYIEYDPVIVMIDLVLMSREAQRHILYNTDFKAYWKLFIILTMLETYAVWRSDSLFSIAVNTFCGVKSNHTINSTNLNIPINISLPDAWSDNCKGWLGDGRGDDTDLFIWEKDFYVQFISTLSGILTFIATIHFLMKILQLFAVKHKVSCKQLVKAFSLADTSTMFALPMLVWGNTETSPETRLVHYSLVFIYSFIVFCNVFTVLYEIPTLVILPVLFASTAVKYFTTFHMTPILRGFVT
ncbi:protein ARV1 isoform X2 [Battus philenor]|uniref:protein ARV1 isoform X2 n=1 Tax=Battus philenor TaxID=42288 RepID=UPI0035D00CB2